MNNIPSSFIGYNKNAVNNIISQKDSILETQQRDIEYLRGQICELEKCLKNKEKTKNKTSKKESNK